MALFNEDGLKKKLDDLNMSQQSIQTLSLWLIHHKKHSQSVVNVWANEIAKASDARKLTYMYLANDVIQNSKKKGSEYSKEFEKRLPKVFEHLAAAHLDEKCKRGLHRLMTVWEERGVFSGPVIETFKKGYGTSKSSVGQPSRSRSTSKQPPAKKPRRSTSISAVSDDEAESGLDSEDDGNSGDGSIDVPNAGDTSLSSPTASPNISRTALPAASPLYSKPPPDPEKLIAAIQALETAATADADVREQIANLPTEVTDASALAKLKDANMGRTLHTVVNEALELLINYNARLAEEMEARKDVTKMLHDSILYQKDKLVHTEDMLEDYRQKLNKVLKIKAELKCHIQNLPDISRLPNMSATLTPLPSAGDLFTAN